MRHLRGRSEDRPSKREAVVEEPASNGDTASESHKGHERIEVAGCKPEDHSKRASKEHEGANHDAKRNHETQHWGRPATRLELALDEAYGERTKHKTDDFRSDILHDTCIVELDSPDMSLMKQAMQNPMFPGFPKIVRRTAAIPTMQPVKMSRILPFDRPFGFSSDDFIKISFARVNDTILFLKRQWTLRILHCCGIIVCMFICRAGSFHEENILG